jgi:polyphosphate kinase
MEPQQTAVTTRRQTASRRQLRAPHAPLRVVPARDVDPSDLKNPALYINRELSWLAFNERVLEQARDAAHPLLERVKFLGITGRNLDEFYMIRIATTLKKLQEGIEDVAPDGYNTEQQLDAMRAGAKKLLQAQAAVWEELRRELVAQRISFLETDQWTSAIREHLSSYFSREICPVLTHEIRPRESSGRAAKIRGAA